MMNKVDSILHYVIIGILAFFLLQAKCRIDNLEKNMPSGNQPTPDWLPDDVVTYAELEGRVIKIVNRVSPDSVFISTEHVPPESEIRYIVRTDTVAMGELQAAQLLLARLEQEVENESDSVRIDSLRQSIAILQQRLFTTEIDYDRSGFCFEPALGLGVNSRSVVCAEGGVRLWYYDMFGAGLHATVDLHGEDELNIVPGLAADMRIRGWENAALFMGVGRDFKNEEFQASAGIRFYPR